MASRDFSFLSLRPPMIAYQANGLPIPPNTVLITSSNGAAVFSNTVTISTINVSTTNTNTISSNIIDANTINANTINANFIDVNVLSTVSHFTSTISAAAIFTSSLQANDINVISSLNVTSTINVSTLISYNISTSNIITEDISVISSINLLNTNANTLELTWNTSTLFIDGHPVATDGTVSTVSTVFWDNLGGNGSIFNKNIGTGNNRYLVGIGTGTSTLNATLDVNYTGISSVASNVFNVSTFNNRFAISNSSDGSNNSMTGEFINNQNDAFATSLRFVKTQNFNSTVSGNELGYIDFYGTNPSLSTVRGAYIIAKQSGTAATFTTTDLQFVTCTSSVENINMVITSGGNVGINTSTPQATLDVNGNLKTIFDAEQRPFQSINGNYVYVDTSAISSIRLGGFKDNGGVAGPISLCLQVANSNTSVGNVGIGTINPQATLDVNGNIRIGTTSSFEINLGTTGVGEFRSAYIFSDGENMQINNQQSGNLSLATSNSDKITILSSGNVGIGTTTPIDTLDVNGSIVLTSSNTTISRFTTQGGDSFIESANTLKFTNIDDTNTTMVIQQNPTLVGINTTNPQATLDVAGDTIINGTLDVEGNVLITPINPSSLNAFKIQLNGTNITTDADDSNLFVYRFPGTNDTYLNNTGGGALTLGTNDFVSTLQIKNNGNVNVAGDIFASTGFITGNTQYLNGPKILFGNDTNSTVIAHFFDQFDTVEIAPVGNSRSQIKFNVATSDNSVATTQMILSHDGRLGINTTTPQDTLDVNGSIVLTSSNQTFLRFTSQFGDSFIESASTLKFTNIGDTNTTMVIQQNPIPRVGINTTNPLATLDVNGSAYISSNLSTNNGIVNQNSGIRLIKDFGNSSTRPSLVPTSVLSSFVIHGAGQLTTDDDGFLQLSAGGGTNTDRISYIQLSGFSSEPDMNQNIVFGTLGTERMRILSNGNVGINTNNPQATLDVTGSIHASASLSTDTINMTNTLFLSTNVSPRLNFGAIQISGGADENAIFIRDGGDVLTGDTSGYFIGVSQNFGGPSTFQIGRVDGDAEPDKAIYLTQSGNVGINTNNPQVALDVNGNLNVTGSAISRVTTAQITSNPGSTYTAWTTFLGKYCFVDGIDITLPTSGLPVDINDINGTIIVIRNISGVTTINVTGSIGNTSILPGKTSSYVFTNSVTPGWYGL